MTSSNDPHSSAEGGVVVDNWPMTHEATRLELEKTQAHLQRYQTALRLANTEIEQYKQGITALTTFAYQSGRVTSLSTLLRSALTQAMQMAHAATGAIILIDEDSKALTLSVHKGLTPALRNILVGSDLENGATILMPHLVAGRGALLEYANEADPLEQQLLQVSELTSLVSFPIHIGKKLRGALLVGRQDERLFSSSELHLLLSLSQETALALENLRLREGLWFTAEALLREEKTAFDLNHIEETDVPPDAVPPPPVSPNRQDVAQLLQTTVATDQEVAQQNFDLQTLNAIAEIITRTLDLSTILQSAVAQAKTAINADAAWLYLENKTGILEMHAHSGLSSGYVRGMSRLEPDSGIEGWVVRHNKPWSIPSVTEDTYKHKFWIDKEQLHALAAVPITRLEPGLRPDLADAATTPHVIGVLVVGQRSRQAHAWSEREMHLLTAIASQIAPAIDKARLYAQVCEAEAEQRTGNEILRTINDMLLEKNAFLEGFIQDDVHPALIIMNQALQALTNPAETITYENYKKGAANLLEVVEHLMALTQETDIVSTALDTAVKNVADEKEADRTYPTNPPLRMS